MNLRLALGAVLALSIAPLAACGSDNKNTPADAKLIGEPPDAAVDAAPVPSDASCITAPTTSDEMLNACTDSQKVAKKPTLPLLNADGSLPALP
jgi:hypothetical protein